jgi:hypothetical protein
MDEWIRGYVYQGEADILPNHDFEFYEIYPGGIVG